MTYKHIISALLIISFGAIPYLVSSSFTVSQSAGLNIGLFLLALLLIKKNIIGLSLNYCLLKVFSIIFTIIALSLIANLNGIDSYVKSFVSILLILFLIYVAYFFALWLYSLNISNIIRIINTTYWTLSIISLVSIGLYAANITHKSVLLFAEPSHFSLFFGVLSLVKFVLSSKESEKIIILCITAILVLLLPNFTLFFYIVLMVLLLGIRNLMSVFFIISLFLLILNHLDLNYFTDRIYDDNNLSAVVYQQGWELIHYSLTTSIFGAGFQNLITLPLTEAGEFLLALGGLELNRQDGSFLSSKLLGEFGWLGLVLFLYYLYMYISAFFYIAKRINKPKSILLIANVLIYAFSVEMLVRGIGYFSVGVFSFFVGFFLTKIVRTNKTTQYQ